MADYILDAFPGAAPWADGEDSTADRYVVARPPLRKVVFARNPTDLPRLQPGHIYDDTDAALDELEALAARCAPAHFAPAATLVGILITLTILLAAPLLA